MNLIAYSDSEGSDNETPQAKPPAKTAPKPSFQKVVDRSNPGKIKLQLPTPSQPQPEKDDLDAEAPPAKKARTGGGAFSAFNSMLPAPKRPNATSASAADSDVSAKRGLGRKLGVGVNLKTGAEPAFRREQVEDYDEEGNPVKRAERDTAPKLKEDFRAMFNLPPPKADESMPQQKAVEAPAVPEVKTGAPKPRFMPMSVARGQIKKKKPVVTAIPPVQVAPAAAHSSANAPAKAPVAAAKPAKPKLSLFGGVQDDEPLTATGASTGDYEPLLYGAPEDPAFDSSEAFQDSTAYPAPPSQQPPATAAAPHHLTNIAAELNLTEAERRQLFGRKGRGGPDLSSANIIEFNTDKEYQHNEMLRQQGETVQHNALRSITGTGKNSLKSLINNAATQKDALEEHFASGRRNKKEAGNRYGW